MLSTNSRAAVRIGAQRPRVEHVPAHVSTLGDLIVDAIAALGLHLDDWQQYVLDLSTAERSDGKFAAFEVGLVVPRQNGKTAITRYRELLGALILGDKKIVHSAHNAETALAEFREMKDLIWNNQDLLEQVRGYRPDIDDPDKIPGFRLGNADRAIEFTNGARITYKTRTAGGGRGLAGDLVVLDEAYALTDDHLAALMPLMASRSRTGNPQIWYASSAGMPDSDVLASVRERGMTVTGADRLAYFEWSADDDADYMDLDALYQANPALGLRISEEYVLSERTSFTATGRPEGIERFRRERLGIWAKLGGDAFISEAMWDTVLDEPDLVEDVEVLAFGVDVSPRRDIASIALAGYMPDGNIGITLVDRREGAAWVPDRLAQLRQDWNPTAIVLIAGSAAEDLAPEFRRHGVRARPLAYKKYAQACGFFYDQVRERKLRHSGQPEWREALDNALPRGSRDGLWTWSRKDRFEDITPVIAVTLALEGLRTRGRARVEGTEKNARLITPGGRSR